MSIVGKTGQKNLDRDVYGQGIDKYLSTWVGSVDARGEAEYLRHLKGSFGSVLFVGRGKEPMNMAREVGVIGVALERSREHSERDMAAEGASFVIDRLYDLRDIADSI